MVGSDPYIVVPVLQQTPDAEVGQTVRDTIASHALCRDAVKTGIGGNPHFAATALEKASDKVTNNVMMRSRGEVGRLASRQMVHTTPFCAHPRGTILREIQVAYGCAWYARKLQGDCNPAGDLEGLLSDHPNAPVRRAGDAAKLSAETRQRSEADLCLLQAYQPVWRSYPEAMVGVLEDAKHSFYRKQAFVPDACQLPIPIGP
jgi:hypothetical protein